MVLGVISHLQVYKLVVQVGNKTWFLFRRYNEFHTLYEKVMFEYVSSLHNASVMAFFHWAELCMWSGKFFSLCAVMQK